MNDLVDIRGAGGGGGSGGGGSESPDSLRSTQYAEILDLISEGEIEGLTNGLRSIYINGVPLKNADGTRNFDDVSVKLRYGTQGQTALPGLKEVANEVGVGVTVTHDTPVVRTILDNDVDYVRVTISVPTLMQSEDDGDIVGAEFEYAIDVQSAGGGFVEAARSTVSGKTTSTYTRSKRVRLRGSAPWDIRVRRITEDSDSALKTDLFSWASYTELKSLKLRYPNSALAWLRVNAEQFNAIPSRAYDVMGIRCRVPVNYNPITRAYSGVWNGTFKVAWTDNPAWIYHELVTNPRFGLGDYFTAGDTFRWDMYRIGRYCDEKVPNGVEGQEEPRFYCGVVLQTREQAYQVLQDIAAIFRGMSYWGGSDVAATQDAPSDPVYQYTAANVVEGKFTYATTSDRACHSVVVVWWNDLSALGKPKPEVWVDPALVKRYGVRTLELSPIGVWSRSMAQRIGKWVTYSEQYETETVSFRVGLDGFVARPGTVIRISDPHEAGERLGGRVHSATKTSITLDADVELRAGEDYTLTCVQADGSDTAGTLTEQRTVTTGAGTHRTLTVSPGFSSAPQAGSVWVLQSNEVAATTWRVLRLAPVDESNDFEITAVAHNPSKYAHIEEGIELDHRPISRVPIDCPAPTNLRLVETRYMDGAMPKSRVTISWEPGASGLRHRVRYNVRGAGWVSLPDTAEQSIDVDNVPKGSFKVRVRSVNAVGTVSALLAGELGVTGKTAKPSKPVGLRAEVTTSGWQVFVTEPSDGDWTGLELRLDGANWDDAEPLAKGRANKLPIPFMSAGAHTLRARHWAGIRVSDEATITIQVDAPSDPIVTAVLRSVGSIEFRYNDCTGTQPLRRVLFRIGTVSQQWSQAAESGAASGNSVSHTLVFPATGTHRVFIRGQDAFGNLGEIAVADVVALAQDSETILDLIRGDITESVLAQELAEEIGLISADATVAGSVAARLQAEAEARSDEIAGAIDREVADRDAKISAAIDAEVARSNGEIASAVASEASARHDAVSAEAQSRERLSSLVLGIANPTGNETLPQLTVGLIAVERNTRSDAVSAEAVERSQLAAQLRGNYGGADLGAVSTGLLAQERDARVTAVESLVLQMSLMSAGVDRGFDTKEIWYWDVAGDLDGWTATGATVSVTGGFIIYTSTGVSPRLTSPAVSVRGSAYSSVKARIKRLAGSGWDGRLFYANGSHTHSTSYYAQVADPGLAVGEIGTVEWDMTDLAAGGSDWVDGTTTAIRFALGVSPADQFALDYAGIGRNAPGASQAAILDEAQVRAAVDAAEALSRQALSVKLTGVSDPTNSTLANLGAGLIYDERTARFAADQGQVARISALEASINNPATGLGATAAALDAVELIVNDPSSGNGALAARTQTLESRVGAVRRWSRRANVNGTAPLVSEVLKTAEGQPLQTADALFGTTKGSLTYRVACQTLGTSTATGAVALFKSAWSGTAWSWTVQLISQLGSSGVHPQLYLEGGVPAVRLYASTTSREVAYDIEVDIGAYSAEAKLATDYYTKADTNQAIANQVNTVATRLNQGGDVYNSIVQVDSKATSALTQGATTASQLTSLQSSVDADAKFRVWRFWNWGVPPNANLGWEGVRATAITGSTTLEWTTTDSNPYLHIVLPAGDRFDGASSTTVRARLRRMSGSGAWEGRVYYQTANHGYSTSYYKEVSAPATLSGYRIVEWDMGQLTVGGTDWIDSEILAIRIDLTSDAGDVWRLDWACVGEPVVRPGGFGDQELSASLQQEISTRADQMGVLEAQWSVRAELVSGGIAAIGGFGLIGTAQGNLPPTFDFLVRADKVGFLPPAGKGNQRTDILTFYPEAKTIDGVVVEAGLHVDGLLVDRVKADRIDTRGLTVKAANGDVIFGAGTLLDTPYIKVGAVSANVRTRSRIVINDGATAVNGFIAQVGFPSSTSTGGYLRVQANGTIYSSAKVDGGYIFITAAIFDADTDSQVGAQSEALVPATRPFGTTLGQALGLTRARSGNYPACATPVSCSLLYKPAAGSRSYYLRIAAVYVRLIGSTWEQAAQLDGTVADLDLSNQEIKL